MPGRTGKLLLIGLCLALFGVVSLADTVYLKSGASYEGRVLSESGGKLRFRTTSGMVLTLEKSKIDRIEKGLTKVDEYEERLKAIAPEDVGSLFELAMWCSEAKLYSQKKKVLRKIRDVCPGHPGMRREMRQVWQNGDWVKAKKDLPPLVVAGGDRVKVPESRASLVLPKGWKTVRKPKEVTSTGPDRYAIAAVLSVMIGAAEEETAAAFPEKDGWEKAEPVSGGGMSGHRSRRVARGEDLIDRTEVVVLLASGDGGVRIRLSCLHMEEEVFAPAVATVLRSLEFEAPKLDYENAHNGYAMNLPKPDDEWEAGETEENFFVLLHKRVDATDYARLLVIGAEEGDEKAKLVQGLFVGQKTMLTKFGDAKEKQIDFCGETATLVDGTYLDRGVPCRMRLLHVKHGKRLYLISFDQHEFGQKKTNSAWDTVIGSFRFLK